MPTYYASKLFKRNFEKLTPGQKLLFMKAVASLVKSLEQGRFDKMLRVKRFQGEEGVWEMTWAPNGRALFRYGKEINPGDPHVIWLNVGGHDIFDKR
ncbi:hypothetical protein LLG95_10800 [bacterium]|nr:hypothetical protein [bacterium]